MCKSLTLYVIALTTMGLAAWRPSLSWMAPLSLLILLSGITWMWRAEGHSFRDLGLHRVATWYRHLGWGVSIGLLLPLATAAFQSASGWITLSPARLSTKSLIMAVFKMALVAASEELIFRGYFVQRFGLGRGAGFAVLSSSLLWALTHLPDMVASGLSPTLIGIGTVTFVVWGVTLGIGFLRTENALWFPLGLHYGYNLGYSLLGGFTAVTYHAPRWLIGHPAWAPESGLLGLLVWSITLLTLWRTMGKI
jgi:membrane protease YdiL (CAAX protease family)